MEDSLGNNTDKTSEQAHKYMVRNMARLYSFFVVLALLIVASLLYTQFGTKGEELRSRGNSHAYIPSIVESTRGDILSDDGRIMLTSIPYYDLRIDFGAPGFSDTSTFNKNINALSVCLSEFFADSTADSYKNRLEKGLELKHRYYRFAPRRVNYMELKEVAKFPFFNLGVLRSGFIATRVFEREHPFGSLASRILGFVNLEGRKVGLEGYYDDVLRGIDGLVIKQKISGDFWIPISSELNIDPVDGLDLLTTIDIEMQDIAESALRRRVEELDAKWGTVVVMEVATGDIKVMANFGRDKNNEIQQNYNYAVGTSLEPGSTFKLPVLVTLLENTPLSLGTVFDTGDGKRNYGKDAMVTDTRSGGYGVQTLQGIFEHSSNIGMVEAVRRYYLHNPAKFIDDLRATGIGQTLDLQITGEPTPTIKDPRIKDSRSHNGGWDTTSLIRISQGYAVRVTPLQTLTYYNAVAAGGRMVAPRLVTALIDRGKVVEEFPVRVINEQIASPKVISDVQRALSGVVERGTAQALKNPLYKVAAKTGTAQIANGSSGYRLSDGSMNYLGSVVGYFPADNPRYTMIVAFQTLHRVGERSQYFGSTAASPVFKEVADEIFTSKDIFMERYSGGGGGLVYDRSKTTEGYKLDSLGVPQVLGYGQREAVEMVESRGFSVRSSGYGTVKEQYLGSDSTVYLKLSEL